MTGLRARGIDAALVQASALTSMHGAPSLPFAQPACMHACDGHAGHSQVSAAKADSAMNSVNSSATNACAMRLLKKCLLRLTRAPILPVTHQILGASKRMTLRNVKVNELIHGGADGMVPRTYPVRCRDLSKRWPQSSTYI